MLAGVAAAALLASVPGATAQNDAAAMRARFQQENDAIRKSRMMPKLGELQFDQVRRAVMADRFDDAVAVLESYRDEAAESSKALDALRIDAEKHSDGFRQLQISTREFLRRLNELMVGLTSDRQQPMAKIRADIEETNQHVIHELFPRRPSQGADKLP